MEKLNTNSDPGQYVRLVSATSLFDGHDAAINIMRRIMQSMGAEVIHLGHNRSVAEIVDAAIHEDAHGIALTSYQGGHMETFPYLRQMLNERGAGHVKIYGGGGGVIVASELDELHAKGIDRIFSPDDGRKLGLKGMIQVVLDGCSFDLAAISPDPKDDALALARFITLTELGRLTSDKVVRSRFQKADQARPVPVVGLTGTGGAGKSSLTDELVRRYLNEYPGKKIAVLCVDPTKRKSGGALLGDRIRFSSIKNSNVFLRSLATRGVTSEIGGSLKEIINVVRLAGYDMVLVETAGIGQGDSAISDLVDISIYVMTAEFGAPSQLEKIEMLDFADIVVINKFTRRGSVDALRDVRKQYQRNHELFDRAPDKMPVFGTSAAHFNDPGVNALFGYLMDLVNSRFNPDGSCSIPPDLGRMTDVSAHIIPPGRERYLSEISDTCRKYRSWAHDQSETARELDSLRDAIQIMGGPTNVDWSKYSSIDNRNFSSLADEYNTRLPLLEQTSLDLLRNWDKWDRSYDDAKFTYEVRGKQIEVENYRKTLSDSSIRKVARPRYQSAGDRLYWRLMENVPGEFPYTAGVFPFKRQAEDATRMFAGEGPSERTNKRFHLLAEGQPTVRLSTAFDSITLYGEDPHVRPDIYGKIGESGVSIFTVEEAEQLYAGFDLCSPTTSVSMTINGPAPTILAFFFNTATRQQCRKYLMEQGRLDITDDQVLKPDRLRGATWDSVRELLSDEEYLRIRADAISKVRGTVQADILKEDQGQNTCIFSTEFALRLMGDVQQYFTESNVRNFYSVSISGYHIAEAGANPIHQLAFTLANGFTYVEYYLARGMAIDDFAPNLSFFFSNGMDAEYSVIGRVARRIWSVAMRNLYRGNSRSQMLKYHIQTSGRSLHAQEISFNDIRTTLQALLATYDNAQSLHTNAYDEAITTPTEESVRRALAIQLIINREFGLTMCENSTQGSFIIEELTDLIEEAVLTEFDRISERGGVLGAMELQYQRGEIQSDSFKYEHMKHSGELPLVGVNTFLPRNPEEAGTPREVELTRATPEEKQSCLDRLAAFHAQHRDRCPDAIRRLKETALSGGNTFGELLNTVESCSLGQITNALYEIGGEYRRNI